MCGKISRVVVDTLNGGNSGLLIVFYVFYSVINYSLSAKVSMGVQETGAQISAMTVSSCLYEFGFKACRRLEKPKPSLAMLRKGVASAQSASHGLNVLSLLNRF
jgi:hypothetical protein